MQSTISPQYQALLQQHHLASFEQLWHYQGDWFEPPNRERGGWSGVNYLELADATGQIHGFYLKRQQGHLRRTWRNPVTGEPTFVREFQLLQHLTKSKVTTPTWVFFARQQDKAILLTAALTGFIAADEWLRNPANMPLSKKRALMSALAQAVRDMHQAGVQHRSLYLKHLFVKENDADLNSNSFEVAVIDFEKSRITRLIAFLRLSDLMTLNKRTPELSRSAKLFFFKQYFKVRQLTPFYKKLCAYLYIKSKPN